MSDKCIVNQMYSILLEVAKNKQLITYSQLADKINQKFQQEIFKSQGKILGRSIAIYLHKVCEKSLKEKGFMLGAIIVSKREKIPSKGFFKFAEQVLNVKFHSQEEKINFWKKQIKMIYKGLNK